MAGKPGRSGGQNKLSREELILRGTFRPKLHGDLASGPHTAPVSDDARERVLHGLAGLGHDVVEMLLREYGGWDAARLELLRSYALSCARLRLLEQANEPGTALHREVRTNLRLFDALHLEN